MSAILRAHKLLGVIFLVLLLAGAYLTYAVFAKKFTSYDEVTLQTSTAGLQLPQRADVKIRGVLVGEVLDMTADEDGATITLGLYPSDIDKIPANVTASILPKTLFGEKFVQLDVPEQPEGTIEPGAVITKTAVSTEVEKVLNDLEPLLEAVQPGDLNMTLNAISTALEGRGNQLGENLETVDSYLKRLNPKIPTLLDDLEKTAQVSDIYSDVLPQVADILDDSIVTTQTLETREEKLDELYTSVSGLSGTLKSFLTENEENIVRVGQISSAQLRVLSRYSTEIPCLTKGIVTAGKLQAEAFRDFTLHIILETLPRQPRPYDADDVPTLGETRGPNCLHLPNPPWSQSNPVKRQPNFQDGVDRPTGKGTMRVAPGFSGAASSPYSGYLMRDGSGYAGSAGENQLWRELLAPSMGVTPDQVGDLGALLGAPMSRGAKVSLR